MEKYKNKKAKKGSSTALAKKAMGFIELPRVKVEKDKTKYSRKKKHKKGSYRNDNYLFFYLFGF